MAGSDALGNHRISIKEKAAVSYEVKIQAFSFDSALHNSPADVTSAKRIETDGRNMVFKFGQITKF